MSDAKHRISNVPLDVAGSEIKVGSIIAYATTVGRSACQRVAKVVDIITKEHPEMWYYTAQRIDIPDETIHDGLSRDETQDGKYWKILTKEKVKTYSHKMKIVTYDMTYHKVEDGKVTTIQFPERAVVILEPVEHWRPFTLDIEGE